MKKLYGIIMGTIFFFSAATAQIVYTDVNPDSAIYHQSCNLDLNNDEIEQVKNFNHLSCPSLQRKG